MPSILRAGIARDSPGPAVDMILAEDRLDVGTGSVDHVYWALSDRLGSPRDIVEYDATAGATNVVASSDGGAPSFSAIDWVFGFTAREEDDDVGLASIATSATTRRTRSIRAGWKSPRYQGA